MLFFLLLYTTNVSTLLALPSYECKGNEVMKVGSACVRALLWRKRCVHRRLAATRICPQHVAIAGHVIKLKLNRRGNTRQSKGGLFQFTDAVVTLLVSQCVTDLLR